MNKFIFTLLDIIQFLLPILYAIGSIVCTFLIIKLLVELVEELKNKR